MSKPHFFLNCTHSKRRWKNNQFGGKWLFSCKLMNGQPCDESICKLLNGKKIKEVIKQPQQSGFRVIDEGFLQKITSRSGSFEGDVQSPKSSFGLVECHHHHKGVLVAIC